MRALLCTLIAVAGASLAVPTPAHAGPTLPVAVDKVDKLFNEKTRERNSKTRLTRQTCDSGVKTVCEYKIDESLGVLATSDTKGGQVTDIVVVSGGSVGSADGLRAIEVYGYMLWALAPNSAAEDRGTAIMAVLKDIENRKPRHVEMDDIRIEAISPPMMGTWVTYKPSSTAAEPPSPAAP